MVAPAAAMPEPEIPQYETHSTPSRLIPPTLPFPTPSSNVSAPMSMPIPSIANTPSMSNNVLPSSPDNRAWGMGAGAWGGAGTGSPNMSSRRVSLHAGTTPVTMPEPLPVPGPTAAALRKSRIGSTGSSPNSVDSTTRRNTEANKGPVRSAQARGMASAWGAN